MQHSKLPIASGMWRTLAITVILLARSEMAVAQEWMIPFANPKAEEFAEVVRKATAQARIVGMGECTHYTKECYVLKREIIETLAKSGFRGLVLEVDFGQALIWNDYVSKGIGDLDSIISASGWFTYRTEEFKSVLKMIREHNATAERKFHVFGMEMTAVNHNIAWLKDYLKNSEVECKDIEKLLGMDMPSVAFEQHTFEQAGYYWTLAHEVGSFLKNHQAALTDRCGEREFSTASKIADIFRQYATYVSQSDESLKSEFRDQFSARNVFWCLNSLGADTKLAVWAHNGHVTENALANYDVLGDHLARWFGDEYYSIGFTMGAGEFMAFSAEGFRKRRVKATRDPSITLRLKQLESPFVCVDIRGGLAQDASTELFLRNEILIQRDYGESFRSDWPQLVPINLSRSYDALIYIDQGSLPTTIEWKR